MKYDIIVGIPSRNEEKTISFVAKQVDAGLVKYFPGKKCLIANFDNASTDKTKDNFLAAKTKTEKIYILTKGGGKGKNLRRLFEMMVESGARAGATFDADLRSIEPYWVKNLLSPILKKRFDFILPVYRRHPYDASITNFLCRPLIRGLLGIYLEQPIGGEFAFSRRAAGAYLSKRWDKNVCHYGIDIFLTLTALFGGLKVGRAGLGAKIHRASGPKLDEMFDEVVLTMFRIFSKNKNLWLSPKRRTKIPLLAKPPRSEKNLLIPLPKGIERIEKRKHRRIGAEEWAEIVYSRLADFLKTGRKKNISLLEPLYLDRFSSFIKETKAEPLLKKEMALRRQAEIFARKRDFLLGLLS